MKRFSAGLLTGLLIGLLLAGTTMAFANSSIKLIINGKEIACDVAPQIINGRTMVPARYVAENLGASVGWDKNNNAVVINGAGYVAPAISSQPAPVSGYGNIKGTITYQYNKFIGTRGDVGASVILLNKNATLGSIGFDPHVGTIGKFSSKSPTDVFYLQVDGLGHYEASNIPSGEYIVVVQSRGTWDYTMSINPQFASLAKPLFNSSYDLFTLNFAQRHKNTIDTITIQPNITLDYSHDFGYSM